MGFSGPINQSLAGEPKNETGELATNGLPQQILFIQVPLAKLRTLLRLRVSAPYPADWELLIDDELKASGHTAPGKPDDDFFWLKGLEVSPQSEIEVILTQHQAQPSVNARAHLESSETNV